MRHGLVGFLRYAELAWRVLQWRRVICCVPVVDSLDPVLDARWSSRGAWSGRDPSFVGGQSLGLLAIAARQSEDAAAVSITLHFDLDVIVAWSFEVEC